MDIKAFKLGGVDFLVSLMLVHGSSKKCAYKNNLTNQLKAHRISNNNVTKITCTEVRECLTSSLPLMVFCCCCFRNLSEGLNLCLFGGNSG